MTCEEALEYIHSLYWRGKKSGLEKTKELLDLCGHPERGLRCVHIAGTNGKGSTAAMLASICKSAGYRVGLYTSPYIVRYNERIQVDNEEISDERLSVLTEQLSGYVEQMEVPPSEFEFGTVLAFSYFKEQQCDLVILETGLGGAFDSTNVIEEPLLCIITALGFDHTAQLGNTMTEIAQAKAGIIKYGVPVVFYGENDEGEAVIRKRCIECHSELVLPSFEVLVSEEIGAFGTEETGRFHQKFSYKERKHMTLALPGLYQQKNAAVVLEAVDVLKKRGISISEENVREGLALVYWQARLEVLSEHPLLLADGSHNPQGMQATVESLGQYFPEKKLQFIFGAMADKELTTMISLFLPLAKKVYVTAPSMPRAMKAEELTELCKRGCEGEEQPEFVLCPKVADALSLVKKEDPDEVVVLIGSLYLVGEAKNLLLQAE
ncbi:MAG: bifunctional folylpolyglutamate synthase/dihydrofolate synthase [Lachnospiraceae bacterium]|nr:bifunctional folylpolyglutamate synthase/dihydrofolate synthase [Lachnospiraceae bacterium]